MVGAGMNFHAELVCSETFCNIHDWEMSIPDEDIPIFGYKGGKRPRGRNPWEGFCHKLEAMNRLGRQRKESLQREEVYSRKTDIDEEYLAELIRDEVRRTGDQVKRNSSQRQGNFQKPSQRQQRKGGVPE